MPPVKIKKNMSKIKGGVKPTFRVCLLKKYAIKNLSVDCKLSKYWFSSLTMKKTYQKIKKKSCSYLL